MLDWIKLALRGGLLFFEYFLVRNKDKKKQKKEDLKTVKEAMKDGSPEAITKAFGRLNH